MAQCRKKKAAQPQLLIALIVNDLNLQVLSNSVRGKKGKGKKFVKQGTGGRAPVGGLGLAVSSSRARSDYCNGGQTENHLREKEKKSQDDCDVHYI